MAKLRRFLVKRLRMIPHWVDEIGIGKAVCARVALLVHIP